MEKIIDLIYQSYAEKVFSVDYTKKYLEEQEKFMKSLSKKQINDYLDFEIHIVELIISHEKKVIEYLLSLLSE